MNADDTTDSKFNWFEFRREWHDVLVYLRRFLKNPIAGIRHIPDWNWRTNFVLLGAISAIGGALNGLVDRSISGFILGLLVIPISSVVVHLIVSGFFYYTFLFFFAREVAFKNLFLMLVLANLPFWAMYILSPVVSAAKLVGLAASGLLLIVGLTDYFVLPKKQIVKFVGAIYLVYVVMWIWGNIQTERATKKTQSAPTRESLDILEKELKGQ